MAINADGSGIGCFERGPHGPRSLNLLLVQTQIMNVTVADFSFSPDKMKTAWKCISYMHDASNAPHVHFHLGPKYFSWEVEVCILGMGARDAGFVSKGKNSFVSFCCCITVSWSLVRHSKSFHPLRQLHSNPSMINPPTSSGSATVIGPLSNGS